MIRAHIWQPQKSERKISIFARNAKQNCQRKWFKRFCDSYKRTRGLPSRKTSVWFLVLAVFPLVILETSGSFDSSLALTTITTVEVMTTKLTTTRTDYWQTSYQTLHTLALYSGSIDISGTYDGYGCIYRSLPFNASKGYEISGRLTSNIEISFYLLTASNFGKWLKSGVGCTRVTSPLLKSEGVVLSSFKYVSPNDNDYVFLFLNFYATDAHVEFEAGIPLPGYSTTSMNVFRSLRTQTLVTTETQSHLRYSTETEAFSENYLSQNFPYIALPFAVAIIACLVAYTIWRKKSKVTTSDSAKHELEGRFETPAEEKAIPIQQSISTGYLDLDRLLVGGLPEGYAILILSASWDERNLLLRRTIRSSIKSGRPAYLVSNDISTLQDLVRIHEKNFFALSEHADKMRSDFGNLFKIPGVGNLSEFNIVFATSFKDTHVEREVGKLLIVDVVSDILLRHKPLITLRWLSDFLARRKLEGFTILATLSPLVIVSKEETQPVIDIFDGVIEIYEKTLEDRARRFIAIKKMQGRRYIDTDLMLDRDKLF